MIYYLKILTVHNMINVTQVSDVNSINLINCVEYLIFKNKNDTVYLFYKL